MVSTGVDKLTNNLDALLKDMTDMDTLMPQSVQQLPPKIAVSQRMQSPPQHAPTLAPVG